jgi:hypothetical protein
MIRVFWFAAMLLPSVAAAAVEDVDLALVLVTDVSRSIDDPALP